MAMTYLLPGYAGQLRADNNSLPYEQKSPLYNLYSPRLFGAPPQLTNLCDMRVMSSLGENPGPVGDFYLNNILRYAQIANIIVGHAVFTGGQTSMKNIVRQTMQYAYAMSKYQIFDSSNGEAALDNVSSMMAVVQREQDNQSYSRQIGDDDDKTTKMVPSEEDPSILEYALPSGAESILSNISSVFDNTGVLGTASALTAALKGAARMQQPFYTFEADWYSYINNVKMMIESAVVMLGLQNASVRIGDTYYSMGVGAKDSDYDTWSSYRFISPSTTKGIGQINGIDAQNGETNQYVSFMINPASISESYSNTVGQSQIYSTVLKAGEGIGNEIAFLTNTSKSSVDDALLGLAGDAITAAESIMTKLSAGTGRFTAALASGMARSFTGDHTIFPDIFQSHQSTSSMTFKVQLRANSGDPYAYLMDILVPLFHLLGMVLPKMSRNAASAYSYPPLIQLNIPGVWGTRLGMVTSLQINKNPEGNDFSINGYPLAVDVDVTVADLQHVLMTSGIDKQAQMLNNQTMFDYIAQCAGVDKYRVNGSIRIITKLALAATSGGNLVYNLGSSLLNDGVALINRITGTRDL